MILNCTEESYRQRYDSEDGTGIAGDNRGERLLESTDQSEQKSESGTISYEQTTGKQSEGESMKNMLNTAITIINRQTEEKTDSMKSELKEHQNEIEKQAGKMNESMLSVTEQTNSLLNQLKKKWIPIFFGTMIGVQVLFQIVSILLKIYLK